MEFDTKLEDWINRYLIQTYQRLSQEYFKSYRITFRVALWLDFEQLSSYLFVYPRFLELRYENVTWNLIQIGGLNQEIFYLNLPQVISRVFQVINNSFYCGFMAWFWTIIQLLIRLLASFSSCDIKLLHGIWYKLEDWIKIYLIQTYHRLSQKYFKSHRIAFRVALWLDFEQLSSYLFVYQRLFGVSVWKCYMEFDTNWRIESSDILFELTTGYLKSISSHI